MKNLFVFAALLTIAGPVCLWATDDEQSHLMDMDIVSGQEILDTQDSNLLPGGWYCLAECRYTDGSVVIARDTCHGKMLVNCHAGCIPYPYAYARCR